MRASSASVMFGCVKCSAVIEGELAFLNHLSTRHFEYYPYRCGYCAETGEIHSTTTENKMKHHQETTHRVKDMKILVHKKHDIETKLQAIVEKCRLNTENSPARAMLATSHRRQAKLISITVVDESSDAEESTSLNQLESPPLPSKTKQKRRLRKCPFTDSKGPKKQKIGNKMSSKIEAANSVNENEDVVTADASDDVMDMAMMASTDMTEQSLPGIRRCNSLPTLVEPGENLQQCGFEESADECKIRNEILINEFSYRHTQNAEDGQCKSGNKVFAGRKSWNSRNSKHKKRQLHKCDQCPCVTDNSGHLNRHMHQHTGEKSFKCEHCPYSNIKNGQFVIHMRSHAGIKIYECDQCPHITDKKGNLKTHMRAHAGQKQLKCSQCPYITDRTDHLKRHMCQHTGEKPFKCDQCSYGSIQKVHLKNHIRAHHAQNNESKENLIM